MAKLSDRNFERLNTWTFLPLSNEHLYLRSHVNSYNTRKMVFCDTSEDGIVKLPYVYYLPETRVLSNVFLTSNAHGGTSVYAFMSLANAAMFINTDTDMCSALSKIAYRYSNIGDTINIIKHGNEFVYAGRNFICNPDGYLLYGDMCKWDTQENPLGKNKFEPDKNVLCYFDERILNNPVTWFEKFTKRVLLSYALERNRMHKCSITFISEKQVLVNPEVLPAVMENRCMDFPGISLLELADKAAAYPPEQIEELIPF